jgi:hypothetical protein
MLLTSIAAKSALKRFLPIFGIVMVVGLVLMLTYCAGGAGERADQLEDTIEVQNKMGAADTKAADSRVVDAVRVAQEEKDLNDAIKAVGGPDARRAMRGCVILRQQGRDTSGIAACRGPAGGQGTSIPAGSATPR